LLNRAGQVLQVPVAVSEQVAAPGTPALILADLTLAPLAPGEYVVEVAATRGAAAETRTYAVRLVP
jgi:hypothetical protein